MRKSQVRLVAFTLGLLAVTWMGTDARAQREPFGLNAYVHATFFADYGPPSQMQQDIGVQWSRVGLHWYWIQPDAALPDKSFDFSFTDPIVSSLDSRNIQMVGLLNDPPRWASSGSAEPDYFNWPPADLDEWEAYVRATVSQYKDKIHYWQIWNEENSPAGWRPSVNASQYVDLLNRAYQAIKGSTGVDPSAKIIMGGLSGIDLNYLKSLKDLGAYGLFDIVAVHPYERSLAPEFLGRIENLLRLRSLVHQYGDKPIWYTEVGWPTQPYVSGLTEAVQADYLVRDTVLAIAQLAEKYFWYNFRDDGVDPNIVDHHHGLLRNDMSTKSSYTAFQVLTTELGAAAFWRKREPYPFAQGVISDFETNEPWVAGTWLGSTSSFARTSSVSMGGNFSGQWNYSFPVAGGGTLVTLTRASSPMPGTPTKFRIWVLPDDGDHRLSMEFTDNGGEMFRITLGNTIGTRWQRFEANIDDAVSLGGDGVVHYPITFHRFMLESYQIPEFTFYGKLSGSLYLDDFIYEEGSTLIHDYQFSKKGSFVDVVWTTGTSALVPFPTTQLTKVSVSGSSQVVNDGGPGDADGVANGWTTVAATGSPVYVRWQGVAMYVLDGHGGVHGAGQASGDAMTTPYFGFDVAEDIEVLHAGDGYYVLDGYGGIHAGREAQGGVLFAPYFGFDISRDLELTHDDVGAYVLDGFGGVHALGSAPVISPAAPYFGFDVARDLELLPDGSGYYALDGFGGVHPAGSLSAPSPGTPYFGFDVSRDMEVAAGASGIYVLDGFGGVHHGGGAPALAPATPYFGFNIARALELTGSGGYYVLDGFGGVHAGGSAAALVATPPYFGMDVARDLAIR